MKDNPDYDANDPHVGLVHRIDKDTSGLLVIAKTPDAKTNLGNPVLQQDDKTPLPVRWSGEMWNRMKEPIVGNIARNPRDRMQMAVMSDPTSGKACRHPLPGTGTIGIRHPGGMYT